jgi:signal transduction histidine kinase
MVRPSDSLRVRFMLAAFLPLLLAMAAAWAVAAVVFARTLQERVADQLADAAEILTGTGLPYTPEVLRRIAELQQAGIKLFDADGAEVLSSAGPLSAEIMAQLRLPDAHGRTERIEIAGEPLVVVARPLAGAYDTRPATVVLAGSLRDAREAARRAALGMGLAVVAAGALLLALQYWLVRSLTEPVRRLAAMADDIAAGRRDVRAEAGRGGELAALAASLNEMTRRLAGYERELAERSRLAALGELSARIAHEIRNPLTGLKLHLQLLAETATGSQAGTVSRLLDEANRLELIVASSLALGGGRRAEPQPGDLVAVVEEVLQLMEPSLRHRRIVVTRALALPPPVPMDRDRLKQALLNLLANAADALPGGGTVAVTTGYDAARRRASIAVEDSGPGFAAELLAAPPGAIASDKPFGLGLGLRLCREVAFEHGGQLLLGRSDALGGARATIELPADTIAPWPASS